MDKALVATMYGRRRAKDVAVAAGALHGHKSRVAVLRHGQRRRPEPWQRRCSRSAAPAASLRALLGANSCWRTRRHMTPARHRPDYSALRGAWPRRRGSLRVHLHPVRNMLAGWITVTTGTRRVQSCARGVATTAPDELGMTVGLMAGPDGEPVVMVVAVEQRPASGRARDGKTWAFRPAAIRGVGPASTPTCSPGSTRGVGGAADSCHWRSGRARHPRSPRRHRRDHRGGPCDVAYCAGLWHPLPWGGNTDRAG